MGNSAEVGGIWISLYGLNGIEFLCQNTATFSMEKKHVLERLLSLARFQEKEHPFIDHFRFTREHTSAGIGKQNKRFLLTAKFLVELLRPDILPKIREIYPENDELIGHRCSLPPSNRRPLSCRSPHDPIG